MNKSFKRALATAALGTIVGIATAAPDVATQARPIDARVERVKLDGVVDLLIRQGSPALLVLSGDPRWIDKTTTQQSGDTLSIATEGRSVNGRRHGLRAELTLPRLREVSSESVGSTEVSGFSGDDLELTLGGAGSMKVSGNYKVLTANLDGVGSMNIAALSSDGIDLRLRGAGYVTLSGHGKWLKADLGGLGGLDAQQFAVDSVNLDLLGLGNASVTAHQNITLNLSGLGSVTVYGKPLNRKTRVDGLGKVSWK
jgi:hypothetical protein